MKCLVTSGGGAKGAFSVGALKFLNEVKNIKNFDLISGTSTGALIATLASIGRIDTLVDVYRNTENKDVLRPNNLVDNISNNRPFIYDIQPLEKQIRTHIDQATFTEIRNSDTILCLNAISLQTGNVKVFSNKPVTLDIHYDNEVISDLDMLVKAMLASSNQAVFLPPIKIGNEHYVDGGNREVVPTRVVVNNLNFTEDHEIYVLSNNPNDLVTLPIPFDNLFDVLNRAISIFIQEIRENDMEVLANFKEEATGQVKVYYISPGEELDREFSTGLNFEPGKMEGWLLRGEERAMEVIDNNPGGNFPTAI